MDTNPALIPKDMNDLKSKFEKFKKEIKNAEFGTFGIRIGLQNCIITNLKRIEYHHF